MIGVVILARSDSPWLLAMTQNAAVSASLNSHIGRTQVVIVENGAVWKPHLEDVHCIRGPEGTFNYHRSMKCGIDFLKRIAAENGLEMNWWVLANNDCIFHPDWMLSIWEAARQHPEIGSFSPSYPDERWEGTSDIREGYGVGGQVRGWCLVMPASTLDRINLTEDVSFWCSDNAYESELIKHGIKHAVVRRSLVTHLGGKTLFSRPSSEIHELTAGQAARWAQMQRGEG